MSKTGVEMINPREVSRRVLELKRPVFDEQAIARADEAMKVLSESFPEWLDAEVARLQAARSGADAAQWEAEAVHHLFGAAHDLKGLGTTYGYPLVTQIAASLCRLIETDAGKATTRGDPSLARAHVDAIRAAVRDKITSAAHPIGAALVRALDAEVEALGVAPL
jgi:chemotaxis protein histidine kinase CheA